MKAMISLQDQTGLLLNFGKEEKDWLNRARGPWLKDAVNRKTGGHSG
jgi:hypothetical protein